MNCGELAQLLLLVNFCDFLNIFVILSDFEPKKDSNLIIRISTFSGGFEELDKPLLQVSKVILIHSHVGDGGDGCHGVCADAQTILQFLLAETPW